MPDFRLPDLGEGLTEAEVVTWHVHVGDTVAVDQPLLDVETAKATVEVPSPFAGVVGALHAAVGEVVAVGSALITVTEVAEANTAGADAEGGTDGASGNVLIGYGTPSPAAGSSRRHRRSRPAVTTARPAPAPLGVPTPVVNGDAVAVSSPLVRRLARDAQVDVRRIVGTGPDGLVVRRDVTRAIDAAGRPAVSAEPAERLAPAKPAQPGPPVEPAAPVGRITRIPLTGIRRATADKLSRSRREIPEATVWVDVDATELVAARSAMNSVGRTAGGDRRPGEPVSLTALIARFAVLGLRRFPELNARVELDEIAIHADVHLGVATQTEHGLVVPVVRNAHSLTTGELSGRIDDRARAARARTLTPSELTGGTITINNYGVFGVDGSAAIINHPEVAILGIGRVIDRAWVVDGRLEVRRVGQLTLAFDHRVCDGATAGGFLRYIADCVESPLVALRDL